MDALTPVEAGGRAPAGWTVLADGLHTRVATGGFEPGLALLEAIGAAAARSGQAPDLRLRPDGVDVRLSTAAVHGVTEADVDLAVAITALVEDAGLVVSTRGSSRIELGLDTPDAAALAPFWAAVLAGEHRSGAEVGDEVRDPRDTWSTVWFQRSGADDPRQRWHPDVWVDPGEVPGRIEAAVAAGGTLVSDEEAPAFWVLADPEGNRVCLCTWQSRG